MAAIVGAPSSPAMLVVELEFDVCHQVDGDRSAPSSAVVTGSAVGGDRRRRPSSPACPWSSSGSAAVTRSVAIAGAAELAGMLVVELDNWFTRSAAIAGAAELAGMLMVELGGCHRVGPVGGDVGAASSPTCSWSSSAGSSTKIVGDRRRGQARRHARGRAVELELKRLATRSAVGGDRQRGRVRRHARDRARALRFVHQVAPLAGAAEFAGLLLVERGGWSPGRRRSCRVELAGKDREVRRVACL